MKLLRTASTIVILQLVWLIAGCCTEEHNFFYTWEGMALTNFDNGGAAPVESNSDSLPAAAYGIRIKLEHRMIADAGLGIVPAALATSCAEELNYTTRDSLLAVRIDEMAPDSIGTTRDVTDQFLTFAAPFVSGVYGNGMPRTISELLRDVNRQQSFPVETIDLIRARSMGRASGVRFIVTMTLSGGRVLADTTKPIHLI